MNKWFKLINSYVNVACIIDISLKKDKIMFCLKEGKKAFIKFEDIPNFVVDGENCVAIEIFNKISLFLASKTGRVCFLDKILCSQHAQSIYMWLENEGVQDETDQRELERHVNNLFVEYIENHEELSREETPTAKQLIEQ